MQMHSSCLRLHSSLYYGNLVGKSASVLFQHLSGGIEGKQDS